MVASFPGSIALGGVKKPGNNVTTIADRSIYMLIATHA